MTPVANDQSIGKQAAHRNLLDEYQAQRYDVRLTRLWFDYTLVTSRADEIRPRVRLE